MGYGEEKGLKMHRYNSACELCVADKYNLWERKKAGILPKIALRVFKKIRRGEEILGLVRVK